MLKQIDKHTTCVEKSKIIWGINPFFLSITPGVEKNGVNPPHWGAMQWMYFLDSGM